MVTKMETFIVTGMQKSTNFHPYRLAVLKNYSNDLTKRWNVEFWAWDEETEQLKRKQIFISSHKYPTARERRAYADAVIREVNRQLVEGYHFTSEKITDPPLTQAVHDYLEWKYKRLKKKADYRSVLQNIFLPYMKKKHKGIHLSQVTKPMLIAFLDYAQTTRNWTAATYNQKKSFVFNMFKYYLDREVIEKNPCMGIPMQRVGTEVRYYPFQESEVEYIRKDLEEKHPELLLYTHFIYYCFLRPNEVRLLKVSDVDLMRDRIRVRKEIAKNNSTQFIQLPKAFKKILLKSDVLQSPGSYYIFGNEGKPGLQHYGYNTIRHRMRKYLNSLGYDKNHSLYSFKHTGCCKLYMLTKDLKLVSSQCRHHSTQVTDRYLRGLGMYTDRPELDDFL